MINKVSIHSYLWKSVNAYVYAMTFKSFTKISFRSENDVFHFAYAGNGASRASRAASETEELHAE